MRKIVISDNVVSPAGHNGTGLEVYDNDNRIYAVILQPTDDNRIPDQLAVLARAAYIKFLEKKK